MALTALLRAPIMLTAWNKPRMTYLAGPCCNLLKGRA